MSYDIELEKIKKYLDDSTVFFDPEKETYKLLKECSAEESTARDMLEKLSKIGEIKDYPEFLRNFYDKSFKALEYLEAKDKEIENIMEELDKEHEILKDELKKRNIEYNGELNPKDKYVNQSYNEKKENIDELKDDLENLKDKNYALKNNEKNLGEAFDEDLVKEIEASEHEDATHNNEMEKINELADKNKIFFNNPTVNDFKNYYQNLEDNQTELSKLDVTIEYKNDSSVEVRIGYKGTEVNEQQSQVICTYDEKQMEYFNNEILPYLVEKHVIDSGGIKDKEAEDDSVKSENVNGEALAIIGSMAAVSYAQHEMDENVVTYVDNPNKEVKDKGIARQIKRDFNNITGVENKGSLVILLMFILVVIVLVVFLLIR